MINISFINLLVKFISDLFLAQRRRKILCEKLHNNFLELKEKAETIARNELNPAFLFEKTFLSKSDFLFPSNLPTFELELLDSQLRKTLISQEKSINSFLENCQMHDNNWDRLKAISESPRYKFSIYKIIEESEKFLAGGSGMAAYRCKNQHLI